MLNKRGVSDQVYYQGFALLLAAITFLAFSSYLFSLDDTSLIDKTFLARDFASVITAMHAVPEGSYFEYRYDLSDFPNDYHIIVDKVRGVIEVTDKRGSITYPYGKDPDIIIDPENILDKPSEQRVEAINIVKNGNEIRFTKVFA